MCNESEIILINILSIYIIVFSLVLSSELTLIKYKKTASEKKHLNIFLILYKSLAWPIVLAKSAVRDDLAAQALYDAANSIEATAAAITKKLQDEKEK